jgi:hypothetical protein
VNVDHYLRGIASSVGTRSTQGVFAHRPVAALPTTTNVLMLSVHVGRAALASNLVRQLKNLTFLMRRKRNLPPRIGVVQDIGRALDELVYPQPERNTSSAGPHERHAGQTGGHTPDLSSTGTRTAAVSISVCYAKRLKRRLWSVAFPASS